LILPEEMQRRHNLAVQVLNSYETILAAIAWKGFQNQGRGYVLVALALNSATTMDRLRMQYCVKDNHSASFPSVDAAYEQQQKELITLLASYHPRQEFIGVIVWSDQFIPDDPQAMPTEHWFCHVPQMSPIQAFTAVKRRPSKFGMKQFP